MRCSRGLRLGVLEFWMMRKIGIYVQVPFCQTKCTYCNFHTGVVASSRFAPYVEAVCREIRGHRELLRAAGTDWPGGLGRPPRRTAPLQGNGEVATGVGERPASARGAGAAEGSPYGEKTYAVDTVYIGGGTPSLLDPGHLQSILDAIRETFNTSAEGGDHGGKKSGGEPTHSKAPASEGGRYNGTRETLLEVTLEADPETVEAGIRNISFDLIAGLPHQTRESWGQSLEELEGLAPEHVSVYLLEIDEGSRLGKELLQGGGKYNAGAVPSEDEMAELYEMAQHALGAAGFHHYEISNWAKPGYESKHNLKYWRREPYLGFGAGAHSFSGTERWANAHDAAGYVVAVQGGRLPVEQHETLTAESALEEELFLGLRQLDGIDVARIEREYGVTVSGRFGPLASAGLVERDGSLVRLAPAKLSVSNEVFVELMK